MSIFANKHHRTLSLILGLIAISGCTPPSNDMGASSINKQELRIHGSNTIGEKLMPAMATSYLENNGYQDIKSRQLGPVSKVISGVKKTNNTQISFIIEAHGSSTAFSSLSEDKADLGMSSRRIKTEEAELLTTKYAAQTGIQEHVIALDALAIITHQSNPVTQLSVQQLAEIFSGKIQRWSDVGGPDIPIHLYARDEQSGTWDTFHTLVLKPSKHELSNNAARFESSEALAKEVLSNKGSIGFVGVAHQYGTKLLAIAKTDDAPYILPNKHTIGTESYALSRRLFLYAPKEQSTAVNDHNLRTDFLNYVASNQGQKLAQATGLISYYPTKDKPRINGTDTSARYRSLGALGERLSVNFQIGERDLQSDSQFLRDLERVSHYYHDKRVGKIVLALNDNADAPKTNKAALNALQQLMSAQSLPIHEVVYMNSHSKTTTPTQQETLVEVWTL